ncbi:anhydro-N-acetylmuramic acid kinase [Algibacillus agarilyticus]|uniref:anhydro-N-acetylmuramic acid kinase n=1 Tax=Algibacillus agarilyticus TaxID=2234133 RepID=UPI000DCFD297|nr:anhydro-N-acetylmuramic acid kinase [Algibacillus agarilyticus]
MARQTSLYIGIMSGTSVDAIDVAVVEVIDNQQCHLISTLAVPFTKALRNEVIALCNAQQTTLTALGHLTNKLSFAYAEAVNLCLSTNKIKHSSIIAIGCHGQTVCHSPNSEFPFSMQLVNGNIIAAETSINTITDFRGMDLAVGGQGAPLIPLFHDFLFNNTQIVNREQPTVLLNIGGIANLSILNKGSTLGFDTGPGNILLDAAAEHFYNLKYDHEGSLAASGQCNDILLKHFLSDPYFKLAAPKSTGREYFNLTWLLKNIVDVTKTTELTFKTADIMATLCHLTAHTIAESILELDEHYSSGDLYIFGGGYHNQYLLSQLQQSLPNWTFHSTETLNIDSDYMEAMAFGWLAHQHVNHLPGNAPRVTGAKQAVVCGQLTKAPL